MQSVTSIRVPDKNGEIGEVTLGFASHQDWVDKNVAYLGATIGRFGNRFVDSLSIIYR